MNEKMTLKDYIDSKDLSIQAFIHMCKLGSAVSVYKNCNSRSMPMTYATQKKICQAWEERFNEKLLPTQYLEF